MKKPVFFVELTYKKAISEGTTCFYHTCENRLNAPNIKDFKGYFDSYSQAEHFIMEQPKADSSWVDPEWSISKVYIDE